MSETKTDTLADALPRELKRVRALLPSYYEVALIAPMTKLTIALMEASLERGINALSSGDVISMLKAYEDLKGWES